MPISNPIRFVDLGQYGFLTDEDLDAIENEVTANTNAIGNFGNTFAPAQHSHSYAPVSHGHTISRWVAGAGRNHLRVRGVSSTTAGEVPVMDTDGRCKYFQWNGTALYVQVDATWVGWLSNASDRRLKTHIVTRDSEALWAAALQGLLNIPLVEFDWDNPMTDVFDNVHNDLGVIAQDLQAINPDLVTTDPGGYLHVNVNQCIVQLVAAIKGLNQKVEALEARFLETEN
ncbi:MAG: tail fiber domain-containing protein [Leptolyngbya sp. SIOISBB]|nr:tail fiber domain-containing protein [Leptolyngbya sp. SIOISBB]